MADDSLQPRFEELCKSESFNNDTILLIQNPPIPTSYNTVHLAPLRSAQIRLRRTSDVPDSLCEILACPIEPTLALNFEENIEMGKI